MLTAFGEVSCCVVLCYRIHARVWDGMYAPCFGEACQWARSFSSVYMCTLHRHLPDSNLKVAERDPIALFETRGARRLGRALRWGDAKLKIRLRYPSSKISAYYPTVRG
jgi:hypothetical protein